MAKLTDIYCPACDRQQLDSLMICEQLSYRCQMQNHRYEYSRLMALKPRMKAYNFVEKQPVGTIPQTIWVYPAAWQALHEKYPQNLQTTMCSLLTALADGDSMIIEGEHVRAMQALGITKGREIAGLAQANVELKRALDEARLREKVLEPILKALGGGVAAATQYDPATAAATAANASAEDLPPRAPVATLLPDPDGDYDPLHRLTDASSGGAPVAAAGRAPAMRGLPRPVAPSNLR